MVVLDVTPFYAESGGQVGDRGWLMRRRRARSRCWIRRSRVGEVVGQSAAWKRARCGSATGLLARVDAERRRATALNHSATHLLHAALRQVLGEHVQQKGSLVDPERLRFDFSHFEPMTREQLLEIERLVNREIRENHLVRDPHHVPGRRQGLRRHGAVRREVRAIRCGCCAWATSPPSCAAAPTCAPRAISACSRSSPRAASPPGVRRIEAVTGAGALDWVEADEDRLLRLSGLVKGGRDDLDDKVSQLVDRNQAPGEGAARAQVQAGERGRAGSGRPRRSTWAGSRCWRRKLEGADAKGLRDTLDQLKNKLGSAVVVLATETDGKVSLVAGVTKDLTGRMKAGDLIKAVAEKVGGRGGGRPDMAQAGGTDPAGIPAALDLVDDWVRGNLA